GVYSTDHPRAGHGTKPSDPTIHSTKSSPMRRHIHKEAEQAIRGDRQYAVERKKIRRQRDPEIIFVRHHMAAVTANTKPDDASAHQQDPERMGELVSKHIEENRARQPEERNQPEACAQREEPKFFSRPKPLGHGRARKDGEKCL